MYFFRAIQEKYFSVTKLTISSAVFRKNISFLQTYVPSRKFQISLNSQKVTDIFVVFSSETKHSSSFDGSQNSN